MRVIALAFWSVTIDEMNTMDLHYESEYLEVSL